MYRKYLRCERGVDSKLTAESKLWKLANKHEVFGRLDVIVACDVELVSRDGKEENNVRQCLDYTQATLFELNHDDRKTTVPTQPVLVPIGQLLVLNVKKIVHPLQCWRRYTLRLRITHQPYHRSFQRNYPRNPEKRSSSCNNEYRKIPPPNKAKKYPADVLEARTRNF